MDLLNITGDKGNIVLAFSINFISREFALFGYAEGRVVCFCASDLSSRSS